MYFVWEYFWFCCKFVWGFLDKLWRFKFSFLFCLFEGFRKVEEEGSFGDFDYKVSI